MYLKGTEQKVVSRKIQEAGPFVTWILQ